MIKDTLRKSGLLMKPCARVVRWRSNTLSVIAPVSVTRYLFKKMFHKPLDLEDPHTLNEKIM